MPVTKTVTPTIRFNSSPPSPTSRKPLNTYLILLVYSAGMQELLAEGEKVALPKTRAAESVIFDTDLAQHL